MTHESAKADMPLRKSGLVDPRLSAPVAPEERRREIRNRQLRERHWTMLVGAIVVVAAAFMLRLRDNETVAVKWLGVDLPPMCVSRSLFHVECPGCGLTRSFVALASGEYTRSVRFHRLGWILAAAVVVQIPYRFFALRALRFHVPLRAWPVWLGYLVVVAFVVNWLVNLWND